MSMRKEIAIELANLRRQVRKSKTLAHQTAMKVEALEGPLFEIYNFKDRLILFPRCARNKPSQGQSRSQGQAHGQRESSSKRETMTIEEHPFLLRAA